MMTAVSLFAGVGGIDLALERSGVKVTAAVEIDKAARGVLAERFPTTTLFTDVTKVTGNDIRATGFVPQRGIVTAGWPCQGNSIAGRRQGLADPRSGLWAHVVRLLDDLRPAWFLGENVPGLLSVTDGEDFGRVLQDLADLGMGFAYRVLDAQFFGVPQRRRRVFIVGRAGGTGAAASVRVLLEPEGGSGNPPQSKTTGQDIAATLTAGVARGRVSSPGRRQEHDVNLIPTLTARYGKGASSDADDAIIVSTLQGGAERDIAATLNLNDLGSESRAVELVVTPLAVRGRRGGSQLEIGEPGAPYNTLRAGNGGSSRSALVAISTTGTIAHTLTGEGHDASEDGAGRGTPIVAFHLTQDPIHSDAAVPALGAKSGGNGIKTQTSVRRLTPLECERLQGFPDGWTATSNGKPQSDSARYRQMGNSVAVPCVEWIVSRIVDGMSEPYVGVDLSQEYLDLSLRTRLSQGVLL